MPDYRLSRAHLHEELAKIEANGEEVVAAFPDAESFVVFTRRTGRFAPVETR